MRRIKPRDPRTHGEWQEAVNLAELALLLDSCRLYGLIKTEMRPNLDRCELILKRGAEKGFKPLPADKLVKAYINPPYPP